MSFFYLATPYTQYAGGIEEAFKAAAEQAALLVQAGVPVYSPIAHTHPIAIHGDMDPKNHDIWIPADQTFMQAARGLIVCELEGWQSSYGVNIEIDTFKDMGKPIIQMTPGTVPQSVMPGRKKVIGLCGYAGAGKDAAAWGLTQRGWTKVAFADPVRQSLLNLNPTVINPVNGMPLRLSEALSEYGWDKIKLWPQVRTLLQRIGTEAGRNIHGQDCWVNIARRKIDGLSGDVVVTDVRFLNEVAMIRELGGQIIRITRPGVGPVNAHISETLPFEPDAEIINDGTVMELELHMLEAAGMPLPELSRVE
jgi:hypothetical protein